MMKLITAEDILQLQYVGDPNVAPNGKDIAFVHTNLDDGKDGYPSTLYHATVDGEVQPLTFHVSKDSIIKDTTPRWSPDGSQLAFLTNRTGKSEVWMLPMTTPGEARPLIQLEDSIVDFSWSPTGENIVCVVDVPMGNEQENAGSDVEVITRLRYKADGKHSFIHSTKHVGVFEINKGTYEQVTNEEGAYQEACFSADGKQLYYIGSTDEAREIEWIPSIFAYDLAEKTEVRLFAGKGPIRSLSPSPDGKKLAFVGHMHGETMSYNAQVWSVSLDTGECSSLNKSLDRTVDNVVRVDASFDSGQKCITWKKDSSGLYFTALDHGSMRLYEAHINGEVSEAYTKIGTNLTSFDMIDDETFISVQANEHSTGDLVIQSIRDSGNRKQLTHFNSDFYASRTLATTEHVTYTSVDGLDIEGWIMFPPDKEAGKKYPLILQIHGGPHSAYGYGLQHEWQWLAAQGYAVFYANPRGSQGYGEDFLQQVVGDWGGKDYEDLMNGIDYVVEKYPQIDSNELFVTGASYGGYMTNMITARSNRFKAAITQNAVVNLHSMFGTSDIGFYFNSSQLGGVDLWKDEETILKFSPIRYANQVKTPTLILHNEKDYRCPMEQAEQWYMALRRLGVATKLIRFPDESHGLASSGKPSHRLERLEHIGNWFNAYLNN